MPEVTSQKPQGEALPRWRLWKIFLAQCTRFVAITKHWSLKLKSGCDVLLLRRNSFDQTSSACSAASSSSSASAIRCNSPSLLCIVNLHSHKTYHEHQHCKLWILYALVCALRRTEHCHSKFCMSSKLRYVWNQAFPRQGTQFAVAQAGHVYYVSRELTYYSTYPIKWDFVQSPPTWPILIFKTCWSQ